MERKVKYDYAFKLECVELVLKQHYSIKSVSSQKRLHESNIRKWVLLYRTYGKIGLLSRRNQFYSDDFKLKVLKAIDKEHLSLSETRLKFNISSDSIIIKWQKDFTTFGIEGLQSKPKGRPKSMSDFKRKKRKSDKPLTREEELLLENESLRCQLDILKKLQALIQAEEKAKQRRS
jgi:transposase